MHAFLRSAALFTSLLAAPVVADDAPVVVELYTSQGCSSCPPADDMLAELSERDDVLALALHVDYWDYIGWADKFADPAHTRRQQAYAQAAGETTIYTPQFVIGGQDIVIGARGMDIADAIQAHRSVAAPISVALQRDGETVTILAKRTGTNGVSGPYVVQIAEVWPQQTVEILRGENAGQTITYSNIVRRLDVLDNWNGTADFTLQTPASADMRIAVIVQAGSNGAIVGAAKLD